MKFLSNRDVRKPGKWVSAIDTCCMLEAMRTGLQVTEERNDFLWCDSITECRPLEITYTAVSFRILMKNTALKLRAEQSADFERS
jgi:hypothetical protein